MEVNIFCVMHLNACIIKNSFKALKFTKQHKNFWRGRDVYRISPFLTWRYWDHSMCFSVLKKKKAILIFPCSIFIHCYICNPGWSALSRWLRQWLNTQKLTHVSMRFAISFCCLWVIEQSTVSLQSSLE